MDSVTRHESKRTVLARAARSAGGKARAPIVKVDSDMSRGLSVGWKRRVGAIGEAEVHDYSEIGMVILFGNSDLGIQKRANSKTHESD